MNNVKESARALMGRASLAKSITFIRKHKVSLLMAIPIVAALGLLARSSVLVSGLALLGSSLALVMRERLVHSLKKRVQQVNPAQWIVHVNDVRVGQINDAQYAAIQLAAYTSPFIWARQIANVATMIWRVIFTMVRVAPMLFFWLAVAALVFAPDEASQAFHALSQSNPQELKLFLSRLGLAFSILMVMTVPVCMAVSPETFGLADYFDEAIAEQLRLKCNQATKGRVALSLLSHQHHEQQQEIGEHFLHKV